MATRAINFKKNEAENLDIKQVVELPRELTYQVSAKTLTMMDNAAANMRAGLVSDPIDLSEFDD